MDQYPFNFEITIVGCDVDDFIADLQRIGYVEQAEDCLKQFEKQLKQAYDQ